MSTIDDGKTVVSHSALEEEVDPENHAQSPDEVGEKVKREAEAKGGGVGATIKAALHHADRELAGEYERREDPEAAPSPQATRDEQMPPGQTVAGAQR